ncbi:MAG: hypothetical protein ACRD8O_13075, partial [Bryobacteraceae bacterium]
LDAVVVAAQTAGVAIYAATYSAYATAFTAKPSDAPPQPLPKGPPPRSTDPEIPPDFRRIPVPSPAQRVDILGGLGELARLGMKNTAQALITGTGGATFSFTRLKGLEDAIQKLAGELHTQYLLSFTPEARGAGFHRLEVRVTRRDGFRGDLRIRARPGYWPDGVRPEP